MPRGDGTWGSNNPTGKEYERFITYDEGDIGENSAEERYINQLKGYSELETKDAQFATFDEVPSPDGYLGETPVYRIHMPQPTSNSQHHVQWRLWKLRAADAIRDLRLDGLVEKPEEPEAEEEAEEEESEEADE
jgi:hypothetical protein